MFSRHLSGYMSLNMIDLLRGIPCKHMFPMVRRQEKTVQD